MFETMGIGTIAIIILIVWYGGSAINSILAGSGEVASKEFESFKQQQDIRLFKNKIKLHKQVEKIKDSTIYSDDEWNKIFNGEDEDA